MVYLEYKILGLVLKENEYSHIHITMLLTQKWLATIVKCFAFNNYLHSCTLGYPDLAEQVLDKLASDELTVESQNMY